VAKEHGVRSEAEVEGLRIVVPLETAFSVRNSKDVSESKVAIDNTLNNIVSIVKRFADLPDIALRLEHGSSLNNFDIIKLNVVVELQAPILIKEQREISSELLHQEVHNYLIGVSSHGAHSKGIENDASLVRCAIHPSFTRCGWKHDLKAHWVLDIPNAIWIEIHVW